MILVFLFFRLLYGRLFLSNRISDTFWYVNIRWKERIFRVKNIKTCAFFETKTETGGDGIIFHRKESGFIFSISIRRERI